MTTFQLLLILYIAISIFSIIFVIIEYKFYYCQSYSIPTIENLIKDRWFMLIIAIIPIFNIILFLIFGGYLLWDKIKNIKI